MNIESFNRLTGIYCINNSSSKYHGISFNKKRKRWVACVYFNGNRKFLGYFKNENDAALSYNSYVTENKLDNPINFTIKGGGNVSL